MSDDNGGTSKNSNWGDYGSPEYGNFDGLGISVSFGTPFGYGTFSEGLNSDGKYLNVGLGYPDWGRMLDSPLEAINGEGEVTIGIENGKDGLKLVTTSSKKSTIPGPLSATKTVDDETGEVAYSPALGLRYFFSAGPIINSSPPKRDADKGTAWELVTGKEPPVGLPPGAYKDDLPNLPFLTKEDMEAVPPWMLKVDPKVDLPVKSPQGTYDPLTGQYRPSAPSNSDNPRPPSSIGTEAGTKGKSGSSPSGADPALKGGQGGKVFDSSKSGNDGGLYDGKFGTGYQGSGNEQKKPGFNAKEAQSKEKSGFVQPGTKDKVDKSPSTKDFDSSKAGGGDKGPGGPFAPSTKTTSVYKNEAGKTITKTNTKAGPKPVVLDLDNDGVEITELSRSTTFMDSAGDGLLHRTAWAGAGDGVLFYDVGNNGLITEKREYVFTEWDPTATSDLKALKAIIGDMADRPGAANNLLKVLRVLLRHAIDMGLIHDNPARNVRKFAVSSEGFHSWSESDVAAFEAKHMPGSRAHLALSLLLYTGQRRSDVVRMGWQHINGDLLSVVQDKTGEFLKIPFHPKLAAAIGNTPRNNMTFLLTELGAPFTAAGFGNWFRDRCNEAGLPHCSAHGLRKACAARLANAGCTSEQIKAITGHKTLSEVARYTKAADQERNAKQALVNLLRSESEQSRPTLDPRLDKTGEK